MQKPLLSMSNLNENLYGLESFRKIFQHRISRKSVKRLSDYANVKTYQLTVVFLFYS
jgi:hypothetical protein